MKKRILSVLLCAMGLSMHASAAELVLDKSLIANGSTSKWGPQEVRLKFDWGESGGLNRYAAEFNLNKRTLFDSWKVIADDGVEYPFPFVVEATLLVPKNAFKRHRVVAWAHEYFDSTRGTFWNGSIGNEIACYQTTEMYLDTPLSDFLDYNDPTKIGIGIYGATLSDLPLHVAYYVDLWQKELFTLNPSEIQTQLRFRLNVDVRLLKKYGVTESQINQHFELGKGWGGSPVGVFGYGFAKLDVEPSAQDISQHYSFSIDVVKDDNGNAMVNPGIANVSNLCPLSNTSFEDCTS